MYLQHAFTAKVLDSRNYCLTVWSAKPAAAGAGIPARVPPVERIIYRHRRNQYVTLPELFFKYRYHFSCRELYLYYCGCEILAMRKARYKPPPGTESHAAERREAAKARYKQGNHYGFADGERQHGSRWRQPCLQALLFTVRWAFVVPQPWLLALRGALRGGALRGKALPGTIRAAHPGAAVGAKLRGATHALVSETQSMAAVKKDRSLKTAVGVKTRSYCVSGVTLV